MNGTQLIPNVHDVSVSGKRLWPLIAQAVTHFTAKISSFVANKETKVHPRSIIFASNKSLVRSSHPHVPPDDNDITTRDM